jgi:hypothetical protein
MAGKASSGRRRRRRRHLLVLTPLPVVAIVAAALSGGGARATSGEPSTSYAALASTQPSGLPLVSTHHLRQPGDPVGPTWPATAPADAHAWPIADTIRRLALQVAGLSAWIARSSDGGVCVMLYDGLPVDGYSAVDVGCSPAGRLDRGASVEVLEIPGRPGEVIAAGVVPDGVTAVSTAMADGSTVTVPVSGNAWARVTSVPAAAGAETTEIAGG